MRLLLFYIPLFSAFFHTINGGFIMKKIICLLLCALCIIPVACKNNETGITLPEEKPGQYIITHPGYADDNYEWRYTVDDSSVVNVDVNYAAQNSEVSEEPEENFGIQYKEENGKYVLENGKEYKYKLFLEGKMPNAAYGSSFTVLSNNDSLTFDEVARSLYSSDSNDALKDSVIIGMGLLSEKEANEKFGYTVYYLYNVEGDGITIDISQMVLLELDYKTIELVLKDDKTGMLYSHHANTEYDITWTDSEFTHDDISFPYEKDGDLIIFEMAGEKYTLAPAARIETELESINELLGKESEHVPEAAGTYQLIFNGKKKGNTIVKFDYHSLSDNNILISEIYEVNVEEIDGKLVTTVVMTSLS